MTSGPFRLLAVASGLGGSEPVLLESLAARGLREGSSLLIERLTTQEIAAVPDRIERFDPDAIFSGGSTQTVKIVGITRQIPIIAWGHVEELIAERPRNVCGYRPPADHQRSCLVYLKRLVPHARKIAALYDDGYPPGRLALEATSQAAPELGLELTVYSARDAAELERAFVQMAGAHVDAVRVMNSPFLGRSENGVVRRALERRLPLMAYEWNTKEGALLSYVPDFARTAPLFAEMVAGIAGGAHPARFGIQVCPMSLHLNRRTADLLGIEMPADLLAEAAAIHG